MKLITAFLLFAVVTPFPVNATIKDNAQLSARDKYFECRMITAADLKDSQAPKFEDYKVPKEKTVKEPKVDTTSTEIGRTFRTVLKNQVARGANFAGHYRVALWGCGSSCSSFAVINITTGKVILPDNLSSVSGNHLSPELEDIFLFEGVSEGAWGYRYKLDSRLIVFIGTLDEDNNREGAYYYILENDRLKLVHQTRVTKDCKR